MMLISYTLYEDNEYYSFYKKGVEYNYKFAKMLMPKWNLSIRVAGIDYEKGKRCYNMMQRFMPTYTTDATHILCRDADSIITYREALEVTKWLASGRDWHGINDNPAHSIPMMGGLIGFKTEALKKHYPTFESLIEGFDLSEHGSDQDLIMKRLWPIAKESFYHSNLTNREPQPTDNPLWETDLVQRYIGSAGYNEMEVLRLIKRFYK